MSEVLDSDEENDNDVEAKQGSSSLRQGPVVLKVEGPQRDNQDYIVIQKNKSSSELRGAKPSAPHLTKS